MVLTIRAQLHGCFVGEQPILAHEPERAAEFSSTFGIGKKTVAFDPNGIFRFDDFDRNIGDVGQTIGARILPVHDGAAAGTADIVKLEQQERPPVAAVARKHHRELRAADAGGHPVGQEFGECSVDRRADPIAGKPARAEGRWEEARKVQNTVF